MTPTAKSIVINWTLVALAAVSLALVVLTRETPTSNELEGRRRHVLAQFDEAQVSRIELSTGVTVVRGDGDPRFRLTAPLEAAAEDSAVDRLLRAVHFATWLRRVAPEDVTDQATGLDSPELTLAFDHDGRRIELALGGSAPSPPRARYLRVSDGSESATYVVSESTAKELSPVTGDFRVQRLLPARTSDIARLEFARGDQRVALVNDRGFRFETAFGGARLDPELVDRLFLQLARTTPEDFIQTERALSILAQARAAVTLTFSGKTVSDSGQIVLGGICPDRPERIVAVRTRPEPIAACIQSDLEVAFVERPELLLDRQLFRTRVDEAEEVRIDAGTVRLEFARRGDGFQMRVPETGEIAREVGLARLESLLGARGEWLDPEVLRGSFQKRTTAAVTESAVADADRGVETVELGSIDDLPFVVRRLDDGALLQVDPGTSRAFSVDALMLRSRSLLKVPAESIRSVEIAWGEFRQRISQPSSGVFELEHPEGFRVDDGLASDLVNGLRQLEASEWVSEAVTSEFGFEDRPLVCTLELAEPERTVVLELGGPAPGGVFATLDRNGTFVLPRTVRDQLTTWLVDRSAFMLDTAPLERLELDTSDRRLVLERLGTGFVPRGSTASTSAGRIVELLDAFSLLRAEAMINPGRPTPAHGSRSPTLTVTATTSDGKERTTRRYAIGNADTFGDLAVYYAWPLDTDGVYLLPRESVRHILDLW